MAKKNGSGPRHKNATLARRIRSSAITRELTARLASFYLRVVWHTTRWRVEGAENRDNRVADKAGFVVTIWHGRLYVSPCLAPPSRDVYAMISDNRDGEIIARVVGFWGVLAVRGSTADPRKRDKDKGGRDAYRDSLKALADGGMIAMTPDGPRGPRMRAQPGASAITANAGAYVVPVGISTAKGKLLRNWDRFLIPFPFGRGAIVFGAALAPPDARDEAALEAHRLMIETETTAATRRADEICGRETPEPADEIRA